MQHEINKEIVFSTAHITEADNELLADMLISSSEVSGDTFEYGHRVHIPEDFKNFPTNKKSKLSNNFWYLMELAWSNDCKWLVLDQDGPEHEELTSFDW